MTGLKFTLQRGFLDMKDKRPSHTAPWRSASYLPLTHVQQGGSVTGGSGQFALEQFTVEEAPGAAVFPRQRLTADIVDKQRRIDAGHKESSQLHAASIHLLHLTANTQMKNDSI